MKKLLSLLAVITITAPVAVNVVACGSSSNPGSVPNLSSVLTNTNLGTIGSGNGQTPTASEIIAAIAQFNNLDTTAISVNASTITKTSAEIDGNGTTYTGNVTVTFISNPAARLSDVLTVTDLGTIGKGAGIQPTDDEIKQAIVDQNPVININGIILSGQSKTGAVVTGDGTDYIGQVTVTFMTSNSALDLSLVLVNTDLGTLGIGGGIPPTETEVLNAAQSLNPNFQPSLGISVVIQDAFTALITGDGTTYIGSVQVTFMLNTDPAPLGDVLTVTNLGTLGIGGGVQPTDAEILAAVQTKNPTINGANIDVDASTITNNSANIVGDDMRYTGTVTVTFTVNIGPIQLNQVLTTTALGTIGQGAGMQPTDAEILAAILANNLGINTSLLTLSAQTMTGATVTGDNLSYTGTVNVTFTTNTAAISLPSALTNRALGTIGTGAGITPTAVQITTAIRTLNPNINTAKITITAITTQAATVTSSDPTYYTGTVNVTFTTSTATAPLNQVVTTTALGTIGQGAGIQPTNAEIITAVGQKNPIVDVNKINIQGTPTATSAVIVGDGTKYSGTVNVTFTTNTAAVPLNQILRNTDLGALGSGNGTKPTVAQITAGISTKNPGIDTTALTISNNTTIGATVTGNGTKYSGTVNVIFTTTNTTVSVVNGTSGDMKDFTVTTDGTIYAIDFSKPLSVFKKGPSDINFTAVTVVADSSANFAFDSIASNGNDVWAVALGRMYKKLAADTQFTIAFTNFDTAGNHVLSLIGHNTFYLTLNNRILSSTNLTPTTGFDFKTEIRLPMGDDVTCMAVNAAGDLFAGTVTGIVYKLPVGTTTPTAITGTSGVINAIAVNQTTGAVYAAGTNGIFVSDGTAAFSGTVIGGYDKTKPVTSLAFDSSNNNLYIGNNNGTIYELFSGDTSVSVITGGAGIINTIIVAPGNKAYFGSNNGKVYQTP